MLGTDTLQGINISHLGKRKIIFKMPFLGDMLVPWRVLLMEKNPTCHIQTCCEQWEKLDVSTVFLGHQQYGESL